MKREALRLGDTVTINGMDVPEVIRYDIEYGFGDDSFFYLDCLYDHENDEFNKQVMEWVFNKTELRFEHLRESKFINIFEGYPVNLRKRYQFNYIESMALKVRIHNQKRIKL